MLATRWTRRGQSLADLVPRPSPALVQSILFVGTELAALEAQLNEDAAERARLGGKGAK